MVFESARLVDNDCVVRPVPPPKIDEPLYILAVRDVDTRAAAGGTFALGLFAGDNGVVPICEVIPNIQLVRPRLISHAQRGDDKYALRLSCCEEVYGQRTGCDGLPHAEV